MDIEEACVTGLFTTKPPPPLPDPPPTAAEPDVGGGRGREDAPDDGTEGEAW